MARKTSGKAQGGNAGKQKEKAKGPMSDSQALRTRSMDEILGIEEIDFGLGIGEVHTPKSSIQLMKQRSEVRYNFNEWLQSIHSNMETRVRREGMSPIPILQEFDDESDEIVGDKMTGDKRVVDKMVNDNGDSNVDGSPHNSNSRIGDKGLAHTEEVKISFEDVEEEVNFWNSSLICYVVGSNPPTHVMEGFVRRIWKSYNVDKVVAVKKGIFLVRFRAVDSRDKVLDGHYFFDKKPVVMKPWYPDVDFEKEDIKTLPVWIQLKLGLKYWGEKTMHRIVAQLGDPIKRDEATRNKDKVQYARILVEVRLEQEFPEQIYFINEYDERITVPVTYEWKPTLCSVCKGLGHEAAECRRRVKQVWQAKPKVPEVVQVHDKTDRQESPVDPDGFQRALKPIRVRSVSVPSTHTGNAFASLQEDQEEAGGRKDASEKQEAGTSKGRGDPPILNG